MQAAAQTTYENTGNETGNDGSIGSGALFGRSSNNVRPHDLGWRLRACAIPVGPFLRRNGGHRAGAKTVTVRQARGAPSVRFVVSRIR